MHPQIRQVPPSALLLLDDGDLLPKLRRANGGDVSAGARADHHDIERFRHTLKRGRESFDQDNRGEMSSTNDSRPHTYSPFPCRTDRKTLLVVDSDEEMRETLTAPCAATTACCEPRPAKPRCR